MLLSGYFSLEFLFQARLIFVGTKFKQAQKKKVLKFVWWTKYVKTYLWKRNFEELCIRILRKLQNRKIDLLQLVWIFLQNNWTFLLNWFSFCPNARLLLGTRLIQQFLILNVFVRKIVFYVHLMVTFTIKASMGPQGQDLNRSSWPENLSSNQYS